jgi:hypothetical protein
MFKLLHIDHLNPFDVVSFNQRHALIRHIFPIMIFNVNAFVMHTRQVAQSQVSAVVRLNP